MPNVMLQEPYLRTGLVLESGRLTVDLAEPRTVVVQGINSRTGEEKTYLLKVTQFGKLVLV